jgi:hypothetical protein
MMTIVDAQTAPLLVIGHATAAPVQQTVSQVISPYAGTPMYAPTPQPTPFAAQGQSVMSAASSFSMPSQTMPAFMVTPPMPSSVMQGIFAQTPMAQASPATSSLQLVNMTPSPSPSPSSGRPPGTARRQVLRFSSDLYGPYAGLLYHSPQPVRYDGEEYPTALHLFEARKFLDHRPEIALSIRLCERVDEALRISAEMSTYMRPDWGEAVALSIVSNLFSLSHLALWLIVWLIVAGWMGLGLDGRGTVPQVPQV